MRERFLKIYQQFKDVNDLDMICSHLLYSQLGEMVYVKAIEAFLKECKEVMTSEEKAQLLNAFCILSKHLSSLLTRQRKTVITWGIVEILIDMGAEFPISTIIASEYLLENFFKRFKLKIDYKAKINGTTILNSMVLSPEFPQTVKLLASESKIDIDVNFPCPYTGETPLHVICKNINSTSQNGIQYLVENKADFSLKDMSGARPIHHLVANKKITYKDKAVSEYSKSVLIDIGRNISDGELLDVVAKNLKSDRYANVLPYFLKYPEHIDGQVLYQLVKAREMYLLSEVLKVKPDLEQKYEHRTPLITAVEEGQYETTLLLLESKAKVDGKDDVGRTPLQIATRMVSFEMVKLLVNHRCNIDSEVQNDLLIKSIQAMDMSMLNNLYVPNLKLYNLDDKGNNVMHICCTCKEGYMVEMIKLFLDLGDKRLLHRDAKGDEQRKINANLLLGGKNHDGEIPLHILNHNTTNLEFLLKAYKKLGVNPNVVNKMGLTPLFKWIFYLYQQQKKSVNEFNLAIESIRIILKEVPTSFQVLTVTLPDSTVATCNPIEFAYKLGLNEVAEAIENEIMIDPKYDSNKKIGDACKIAFLCGFRDNQSTLFKVAKNELMDKKILEMLAEHVWPNPKSYKYLNPRELSCFEQFFFLTVKEQKDILQKYKDTMQNFDHALIVNTAVAALKAFKITNVESVFFPDFKKETPLNALLMPQLKDKEEDFFIFSLPTNEHKHSVPVVINPKRKEFFCYDPEGDEYGAQKEAEKKLQELIRMESRFSEYSIITLAGKAPKQTDNQSCGVLSSMSMISYIMNEYDVKPYAVGRCKELIASLKMERDDQSHQLKSAIKPELLEYYLGGLLLAKVQIESRPERYNIVAVR